MSIQHAHGIVHGNYMKVIDKLDESSYHLLSSIPVAPQRGSATSSCWIRGPAIRWGGSVDTKLVGSFVCELTVVVPVNVEWWPW